MDRPRLPLRTVLTAATLTCRRRSCISHCGVIPVECWCKRRAIGSSLLPSRSECSFGAVGPFMDVVATLTNYISPSSWHARPSRRSCVIYPLAMPATFGGDMDGRAEYSDTIRPFPWTWHCTGMIWWFGYTNLDPATARPRSAGRRTPPIDNPVHCPGYRLSWCWSRWVAPGSLNTAGASCSPSLIRSWHCLRDHRGAGAARR